MCGSKWRALRANLAWLLLMLALLAGAAQAEALQVGQVIIAGGAVEAQAEGKAARALKRRSPLFAGDTVRTGADGHAQLRMIDGELLDLASGTELHLDALVFDADEPEHNTSVKTLVKGGLRAITGAVGKAQYRVNTRAATIGIRGTHYQLQSTGDGLYAAVWQGGIVLANQGGSLDLGMGAGYDFAHVPDAQTAPTGLLQRPPVFEGGDGSASAPTNGPGRDEQTGLPHSETFKSVPGGEASVFGPDVGGPSGDSGHYADLPVQEQHLPESVPVTHLPGIAVFGTQVVSGVLNQGAAPNLIAPAGNALAQWGAWNASSNAPATIETVDDTVTLTEPVYWIGGEATDPSQLPATGAAQFDTLAGFAGYNSLSGNVSVGSNGEFCDININVDFAAQTFNLQLDLTFQSGDRTDVWQATFDGAIDGAQLSGGVTGGLYTQHQHDTPQMLTSDVGGVVQMNFVGAGGAGIAGGYQLFTTDEVIQENTSGVFVAVPGGN